MEINFLLWNTRDKLHLKEEIVSLVNEHDIDFIVLIETIADTAELLNDLNTGTKFFYHSPNKLNFKKGEVFSIFKEDEIITINDNLRYTFKLLCKNGIPELIICIVHFPSKLTYSDGDYESACTDLMQEIKSTEEDLFCYNTIVIGDFNMNPFEYGMIKSTGLHSVMSRDIAMNQDRKISLKKYRFMYNPMWSFLGEKGRGSTNGTIFYNTGKPVNYYWGLFDQVIIRPDLIKFFNEDNLEILTSINGRTLLKKIRGVTQVDDSISDHLPIKFSLDFTK